jgi:hypothetical protein
MFSRVFFLVSSGMLMPLLFGSITYETGGSSIYPLVISILGSIAIILFLSRLGKETWLKALPFVFFVVAFAFPQGSFMNYYARRTNVYRIF